MCKAFFDTIAASKDDDIINATMVYSDVPKVAGKIITIKIGDKKVKTKIKSITEDIARCLLVPALIIVEGVGATGEPFRHWRNLNKIIQSCAPATQVLIASTFSAKDFFDYYCLGEHVGQLIQRDQSMIEFFNFLCRINWWIVNKDSPDKKLYYGWWNHSNLPLGHQGMLYHFCLKKPLELKKFSGGWMPGYRQDTCLFQAPLDIDNHYRGNQSYDYSALPALFQSILTYFERLTPSQTSVEDFSQPVNANEISDKIMQGFLNESSRADNAAKLVECTKSTNDFTTELQNAKDELSRLQSRLSEQSTKHEKDIEELQQKVVTHKATILKLEEQKRALQDANSQLSQLNSQLDEQSVEHKAKIKAYEDKERKEPKSIEEWRRFRGLYLEHVEALYELCQDIRGAITETTSDNPNFKGLINRIRTMVNSKFIRFTLDESILGVAYDPDKHRLEYKNNEDNTNSCVSKVIEPIVTCDGTIIKLAVVQVTPQEQKS